jgi:hypothetical protein
MKVTAEDVAAVLRNLGRVDTLDWAKEHPGQAATALGGTAAPLTGILADAAKLADEIDAFTAEVEAFTKIKGMRTVYLSRILDAPSLRKRAKYMTRHDVKGVEQELERGRRLVAAAKRKAAGTLSDAEKQAVEYGKLYLGLPKTSDALRAYAARYDRLSRDEIVELRRDTHDLPNSFGNKAFKNMLLRQLEQWNGALRWARKDCLARLDGSNKNITLGTSVRVLSNRAGDGLSKGNEGKVVQSVTGSERAAKKATGTTKAMRIQLPPTRTSVTVAAKGGKLPAGFTQATPGGMAISKDPERGAIIDVNMAGQGWFIIYDGDRPIVEGLPSREAAFARWAKDTAKASHARGTKSSITLTADEMRGLDSMLAFDYADPDHKREEAIIAAALKGAVLNKAKTKYTIPVTADEKRIIREWMRVGKGGAMGTPAPTRKIDSTLPPAPAPSDTPRRMQQIAETHGWTILLADNVTGIFHARRLRDGAEFFGRRISGTQDKWNAYIEHYKTEMRKVKGTLMARKEASATFWLENDKGSRNLTGAEVQRGMLDKLKEEKARRIAKKSGKLPAIDCSHASGDELAHWIRAARKVMDWNGSIQADQTQDGEYQSFSWCLGRLSVRLVQDWSDAGMSASERKRFLAMFPSDVATDTLQQRTNAVLAQWDAWQKYRDDPKSENRIWGKRQRAAATRKPVTDSWLSPKSKPARILAERVDKPSQLNESRLEDALSTLDREGRADVLAYVRRLRAANKVTQAVVNVSNEIDKDMRADEADAAAKAKKGTDADGVFLYTAALGESSNKALRSAITAMHKDSRGAIREGVWGRFKVRSRNGDETHILEGLERTHRGKPAPRIRRAAKLTANQIGWALLRWSPSGQEWVDAGIEADPKAEVLWKLNAPGGRKAKAAAPKDNYEAEYDGLYLCTKHAKDNRLAIRIEGAGVVGRTAVMVRPVATFFSGLDDVDRVDPGDIVRVRRPDGKSVSQRTMSKVHTAVRAFLQQVVKAEKS